ncbi:MAG: CHAT domain-containing protein [Cyanobacteria bacterium J06633_2]
MTQEFHISITPIRSDEYLVRTEEVAPGVPLAEEQYVWPASDWLAQARTLMNDPIVGLLQGDRLSAFGGKEQTRQDDADASTTLTTLGQQLYRHLFQGRLRDSWMTAQGIAQHRGEALRLRLGLKGTTLPGIPWEVLNSGISDSFHSSTQHLATGVNILFSRYLADTGVGHALGYQAIPKPQKTIKILMAIAAPTDQQQLKLNQEAQHLQEELRLKANVLKAGGAHLLPDIRVTILEQPGREELAQALEQGQYNIFHYAGHSELGEGGGKIYLVNRQTGLSETLNGNDLAGLLLNNDIQMAVFNSCRGAHTATVVSDPSRQAGTLTDALVNRGIPAVLAMAEQIPDDVALSLTRLFYRNLKQGYPIDLSLSRSRQGLLSAYSSDQLYWALPILYLNSEFDGYLTAGDRSLDNPADSLIRLPHLHSSPLADLKPPPPPPHPVNRRREGTVAQNVTESVFTHSQESPTAWQPPLSSPHVAEEAEEQLTGVSSDSRGQDGSSILEPQDAPVFGEKPELPDDFFLEGDDLQTLEEAWEQDAANDEHDDAESVRNLVEQLEGGSNSKAIAPGDVNDVTSEHYRYDQTPQNGFHPIDASADEAEHDISMVTTDYSSTDSVPPALDESDRADAPQNLLPSADEVDYDSGSNLGTVSNPDNLEIEEDVDASVDPVLLKRRRSSPWKKLIWLPIASVAGAAIVFLGYRVIPDLTLSTDPQEIPSLPDDVNRDNLADKSTQRVAEFGVASFSLNNADDGIFSITELLDRGELDQANIVLDSISSEQLNDPAVIFLQGRLAWQYSVQNNPKYSVTDASEFWNYAAQKVSDPSNQPLYYNALGFALYTEGRLQEAINAWEQALVSVGEGGVNILPDDNGQALPSNNPGTSRVGVPQRALTSEDALTAYSGIALAMTQLSAKPAVEQPYELVQQALQIRQIVLQSPAGVEPRESEYAWLWTDALTQEWKFFKEIAPQ